MANKKSKLLKMKQGKANPLLNSIYMPLIAIFFFIAMAMTVPVVAAQIGKAFKINSDEVRFWGKTISSILGGLLVILVATAFLSVPLVSIPLILAGIVGMGWGIYKLNSEKLGIDAGAGSGSKSM